MVLHTSLQTLSCQIRCPVGLGPGPHPLNRKTDLIPFWPGRFFLVGDVFINVNTLGKTLHLKLSTSCGLDNQWEQKYTGRQALLPPKFLKNKTLKKDFSPYELHGYWQHCIASFSTTSF